MQMNGKKKYAIVGATVSIIIAVAVTIGVTVGNSSNKDDEPTYIICNGQKITVSNTYKSPIATLGGFESGDGGSENSCQFANSVLGKFSSAAVSSDGKPCARIATAILRQNGNAADAAIAGLFCNGVINTQSMGLGGGFLLTYYERASQTAYTLDSREAAPLAAHKDMFDGNSEASSTAPKFWKNLRTTGGLAVGVPGELRGYKALYDRFGSKNIPWADLIQPTIDLCKNGHLVNWHMARAFRQNKDIIFAEPSLSVFINPETNDVYKERDTLTRPKLAETLEAIQKDPDALYTGELADKLVEDLGTFNSIITKEDLEQYQPKWRPNVNFTLSNGDFTLYSIPPPGSGVILGFIMNVLGQYNFTSDSLKPGNSVLTNQRIVEAFKYAYAKRTELGDIDFVDIKELMQNLTSEDYANSISSKITVNETFQDPKYYGAVTVQEDNHGTAHISVLAPNGDAVAITSTINLYIGAKIRSVQTGIVLNDEMDDFSAPNITNSFGLPPSPANFIEPGKHPLSSMCPAIFVDKDGDVRLITGAAGGTKISSGVAQVAMNNLWFGMNIKEAIDARRIHHQLFPMEVGYEQDYGSEIIDGLVNIGHKVKEFSTGGSVNCAVARDKDGFVYANSDFRKAGEVDGF